MPKLHYDKGFYPMIEAMSDYERLVRQKGGVPVSIVVERNDGYNYVYSYTALKDGVDDAFNRKMAERLVKAVLWVCGGYKIVIVGSHSLYEYIKGVYTANGLRAFDVDFMQTVYERPFTVEYAETVPERKYQSARIGGFTDGCRIGFDAGGSDRKVSAVIDGEVVYSEEVVWNPKITEDPHYHYDGILSAMKTAASKMPRVDAIGVSTAGVVVADKPMVSSLFIKVDKAKYGDFVKNVYLNAAKEMNAPIVVANDGDVTALAGSIDLQDNGILGIAMGTSEAVGYVNTDGGLNGWISELAFAPVDFNDVSIRDEWSGDYGVGCKYFSQDAVIKLAGYAGISFEEGLTPAKNLKVIQKMVEEGDSTAEKIFEDIGIYLAYTIPYYAKFYDIKHLLLLGRVMSGKGGNIIVETCERTLAEAFPQCKGIHLTLPDENSRRVGQSIAAASLCPLHK